MFLGKTTLHFWDLIVLDFFLDNFTEPSYSFVRSTGYWENFIVSCLGEQIGHSHVSSLFFHSIDRNQHDEFDVQMVFRKCPSRCAHVWHNQRLFGIPWSSSLFANRWSRKFDCCSKCKQFWMWTEWCYSCSKCGAYPNWSGRLISILEFWFLFVCFENCIFILTTIYIF